MKMNARRNYSAGPALLRWLGALMSGLVILTAGGCDKRSPSSPETMPVKATEASGYAGAAACKECHEEVFNGWRATFHAYKFQPVNPDFIIGDFTRNNTLTDQEHRAEMTREGDRFFVTVSGKGGQSKRHAVDYVVGSVWKQRYVTRMEGGGLFVLPVQWNVLTRSWVGYHGLEPEMQQPERWDAPENAFQFRCMGCHTTNASVRGGTDGQAFETAWSDPGVACEACHGPGAAHVRAPVREKASTIVNPAKMADPGRAAAICGACHTRGKSSDGRFSYAVGFRPGDPIDFRMDQSPGMYPDTSPKEHHQQFNDWQSSGHSRSGVMCWDCHSPHATGKSNRFQVKLPGSMLCATCHTVANTGVHALHSVNNCIGCHMPSTVQSATPGDLRSHRFVVVRPELTVKAGSVGKQPNSCNLCHYHKDTDPEQLVHQLKAAKKPKFCKECHYHAEQDPEDEE